MSLFNCKFRIWEWRTTWWRSRVDAERAQNFFQRCGNEDVEEHHIVRPSSGREGKDNLDGMEIEMKGKHHQAMALTQARETSEPHDVEMGIMKNINYQIPSNWSEENINCHGVGFGTKR